MANNYEIRKRSKIDPRVWSMVAHSDTWEWAKKIADALNILENSTFAIYVGEKEISCREEAIEINNALGKCKKSSRI